MAHAVAVPSPSSAMKRKRKEEVYRLAYINCIKPVPFRNLQNIPPNGCLEEKSIADLISEQKTMKLLPENPYEVVRKPPKKRKKVDDNCFINEALNLTTPEKQFNPYEVQRPADPMKLFEKENHSFVNLALNLKAPEHHVLNPFEIVRPRGPQQAGSAQDDDQMVKGGIENPAMEMKLPLAIAVPFTPTINHRIDFGQLKTPEPPNSKMVSSSGDDPMTPSEMLSKKLVFSPKEQNCGTPKRLFGKSLSTISEEATVDIDEELDCYQLQLENSINEAKLNNRKYFTDFRKDVLKKKVVGKAAPEEPKNPFPPQLERKEISCPEEEDLAEPLKRDNEDEFEEGDSFDDDLKIDNGNYQPFKRAYVRPVQSQPATSKDLMPPPMAAHAPPTAKTEHDGLKGMIRRSIRMITKPKNKKPPAESKDKEDSQESTKSDTIFSSIRRSLRKRKMRMEGYPEAVNPHDLSVIIDESRSVFKENKRQGEAKKPCISARGGDGMETNQVAPMLRNSIRRSTRGVRNHVMKNILHKKVEDYDLKD